MVTRCAWCGTDPLYVAYHDHEWGVPVHDDRTLFEFLILDGAQAGLSWLTILRKREGYRRAFDQFDIERVARYDEADLARLLADPGIVRNRLKVESTIANARAIVALREAGGSLDSWLWRRGKTWEWGQFSPTWLARRVAGQHTRHARARCPIGGRAPITL